MMAIQIANSLSSNGVDSFLCATRLEGDLKSKINDDVEYIFLNRKKRIDIKAISKLKNFIILNEIDIIHAHSSSYFLACVIKLFYPKIKIVWHDHYGHSEQLHKRSKQPIKLFSKFFKDIIVVNDILKNWSMNVLKFSNVHFLPNYSNLSDDNTEVELNGTVEKRIVCVAGLRPQKDHLTLLKAFKNINKQFQDWSLHIVGNHYNDEYYNSIIDYIANNDLENSVYLYHGVTNVKSVLKQSTIGVLSSISEGLPVSLLEYGLAKLPVVVTDVGECRKVLNGGKFGMLAPPKDEHALAKKIGLLIDNEELRNEFASSFNKHILANYSEQKIINKLIQIYNF